ncbi:hypothetical protein A7982_13756 [Minicystis rosea]|nr:hypothetical protein A7982_13756 [Minicystis rosea]
MPTAPRPSLASPPALRARFPHLAAVLTLGALALLGGGCAHAESSEGPSDIVRAEERAAAEAEARADAVRAKLAAHRAQQIARLQEYAASGRFPHNFVARTGLHIFRDDAGRLCAVANLVQQDGRADLVDATARTRNDLAIADVYDGPMLDWVLGSGLTQEELSRIQFPAMPVKRAWVAPIAKAKKPQPKAVAAVDPISEVELQAQIRAHVATVAAELEANRESSLDLAVSRYLEEYDTDAPAI